MKKKITAAPKPQPPGYDDIRTEVLLHIDALRKKGASDQSIIQGIALAYFTAFHYGRETDFAIEKLQSVAERMREIEDLSE